MGGAVSGIDAGGEGRDTAATDRRGPGDFNFGDRLKEHGTTEVAMKAIALLACAIMPLAHAALRPSFLLNRCAWEATEVLELAIAPGESHFRVVFTIKGDSRPGDIKTIPELMPPADDHSLLKDLLFEFPDERTYGVAPPIR